MMQQTYLFKLYKDFKLLFAAVVLWLAGTGWFALHSHEEFPFLLYGMYSLKEKPKEYYSHVLIDVNDEPFLHTWRNDAQNELLVSPVEQIATSGLPESEKQKKYEQLAKWLATYLNPAANDSIKITATEHLVSFDSASHPETKNFNTLFNYAVAKK